MKTKEEIKKEIEFLQWQFDEIKKEKVNNINIAGLLELRSKIDSLRWVLGEYDHH